MTVLNVYDLIVTPETRKGLLKQPLLKKIITIKQEKMEIIGESHCSVGMILSQKIL